MSGVDLVAVREANAAFYAAHEARDLDAMSQVWEHSDRVVCIHPGWPILRGWGQVGASWHQIFQGPGRNQFLITNEQFVIGTDMAWVTLEENLVDAQSMAAISATNVFALVGSEWKMVSHHAGAIMVTLGE